MPSTSTLPKNLYDLISERAKSRKVIHFVGLPNPAGVRVHPDPISLAGGEPNVGNFPLKRVALQYSKEPFDETNEETLIIEQFESGLEDPSASISLQRGLQYAATQGFPQLLDFARELIKRVNLPAYSDWDVCLSAGSGDSLHKVANLLINPGDTVLVEEYTFIPVLALIRNYGGTPVPIKLNLEPTAIKGEKRKAGCIDVDALDDLLSNWDNGEYAHLMKPKYLYTIPTGQNPTGLSQSLSDRSKILNLAKEHNFIVLEDDPYGNIAYPSYQFDKNYYENPETFTIENYVNDMLMKSYMTLDTEGRVIRLETFSKLFAPGMRVGFIVAHSTLIKEIIKHSATSTRTPSGASQSILINMLYAKKWQGIDDGSKGSQLSASGAVDNWLTWGMKISRAYTRKRNAMLDTFYSSAAFTEKNWAKVLEPEFGMFIIVRLNMSLLTSDANYHASLLQKLKIKTVEKGVNVVFGNNMAFREETALSEKTCFVRLTNASAGTIEIMKEGCDRFTKALEEFFEENLNDGIAQPLG